MERIPARIIVFFFMSALVLFSCQKETDRVFRKSRMLMDTLVTITVVADSPEQAEDAIDSALQEIGRLEKLISFWDPGSEISAINREAGKTPVKVSPETLDLIELALYVSEKTGGAFDATIGPVIRLWDFKNKTRPDERSLKKALPLVNFRKMVLDRSGQTAFLADRRMSFDTGGIAKGHAADLAERTLRAKGIEAGLIAIAGDIKAFGRKPDGRGWMVAIRNPRPTGKKDETLAKIELLDEAVSTSGDYERFFMEGGVRCHHLLDPKTGYPARGFRSVSVIAPKGVLADGFSTGIFIMGPASGMSRLKELGFGGIVVDEAGKLYITENMRNRVTTPRSGFGGRGGGAPAQ
jgi:thiamine biosynthesis lipoprotein